MKEAVLQIPEILQDDCYTDHPRQCGAACAQMVLHYINRTPPQPPGEQEQLYSDIRRAAPSQNNWYNPPNGIETVLNKHKPHDRRTTSAPNTPDVAPAIQSLFGPPAIPSTYEFRVLGGGSGNNPGIRRARKSAYQIAQIELLSRLFIRTVAINDVGPIVAVRDNNAHWIVVNGFQVDDNYADANIKSGEIKAILIRNPLGRYTYRTVTCDSLPGQTLQEITGHKCEQNTYMQDVVAYRTWVREYMFSDCTETFVVVSDEPDEAAQAVLKKVDDLEKLGTLVKAERAKILSQRAKQEVPPVAQEPTEEILRSRAKEAISNFNLARTNPSVSSGEIQKPIKVKRLDRIDGYYYLVPVGDGDRISALINLSVTGEFNEATVCPTDHYIVPFEKHPELKRLTSEDSPLKGRKIRLTAGGPLLTIKSVRQDQEAPYVWRPSDESLSSLRPFHNLKVTLEGCTEPHHLYLPVDNYCLSYDSRDGAISLPSSNYLDLLTCCIRERSKIGEVLVEMNQRGDAVTVQYQTQTGAATKETKKELTKDLEMDLENELGVMKQVVCQCLRTHSRAGLKYFRIKAFGKNGFLKHGAGDDAPASSSPHSGGGDDAPASSSPHSGGGDFINYNQYHSIDAEC